MMASAAKANHALNKSAGSPASQRHPFLNWYASLWSMGAATASGKDIILDDAAGKRFGIGVDEGGIPVLAMLADDEPPLTSIRWASAALIRKHRNRDWIALSCKNAKDNDDGAPVPVRLWIPVPYGVLDAWYEFSPSQLRVRRMLIKKGRPVCPDGPPLMQLSLTTKG